MIMQKLRGWYRLRKFIREAKKSDFAEQRLLSAKHMMNLDKYIIDDMEVRMETLATIRDKLVANHLDFGLGMLDLARRANIITQDEVMTVMVNAGDAVRSGNYGY